MNLPNLACIDLTADRNYSYANPGQTTTARGRCIGQHRFMTTECSTDEDHLPTHVEHGQTSTIPFRFQIPERLLPQACSHTIENDGIHERHTLMPPSMKVNRKVIIEDGVTVDAAKIRYGIRTKVIQQSDSNQPVESGRGFREVLVIPGTLPSYLGQQQDSRIARIDVSLQSSKQKTKDPGRFLAEATPPPPFQLPNPSSPEMSPILRSLRVYLRYDCAAKEPPPPISKMDVHLRTQTFYNVRAFRSTPSVDESTQRGYSHLTESIAAAPLTLGSDIWQVDASTVQHTPCATWISDRTIYTASIIVPVTISPADFYTRITPSFSSCTIVRNYAVNLDIHFPSSKPSTLTLSVPITITAEGSAPASAPAYTPTAERAFDVDVPPDDDLGEQLPAYDETVLRTLMVDGTVKSKLST